MNLSEDYQEAEEHLNTLTVASSGPSEDVKDPKDAFVGGKRGVPAARTPSAGSWKSSSISRSFTFLFTAVYIFTSLGQFRRF